VKVSLTYLPLAESLWPELTSRKISAGASRNLGDGDVDWPAVRAAFAEIGYAGSVIAELEPGDEAYLRDVSRRIDRLLLDRA
jgi:sugar phosphate isomerase/epimerase